MEGGGGSPRVRDLGREDNPIIFPGTLPGPSRRPGPIPLPLQAVRGHADPASLWRPTPTQTPSPHTTLYYLGNNKYPSLAGRCRVVDGSTHRAVTRHWATVFGRCMPPSRHVQISYTRGQNDIPRHSFWIAPSVSQCFPGLTPCTEIRGWRTVSARVGRLARHCASGALPSPAVTVTITSITRKTALVRQPLHSGCTRQNKVVRGYMERPHSS